MESCDETSDLATTRLDSDLIAVRSEPREFNPKSRRIHFRDTILDLLAKFLEIAPSVQQALGVRRIAGVMQHHLPYLSNRSHAESARSIGNVRELRQVVARLCARHVGPPPISVGDLPPDERPREEPPGRAEDDTLIRWVRVALAADANLRDIRVQQKRRQSRSHSKTRTATCIAPRND